MTVLTENLQEMTGVNWRREVRFYVPLVEGGLAAAGAIATACAVVIPDEDGIITSPEFLPGRAQVRIDGHSYDFDIPDSPTPVALAPLLGLSIDFPPPVILEAQEYAIAAAASAAAAAGSAAGAGVPGFFPLQGGDPTGSTFSDTAVAATLAAMGTSPGIIKFGAGTYKLNNTITLTHAGQGIEGQGSGATIIDWRGTGDCLRVWDPSGNASIHGGRINGLQITADSNANTGINGIHIGDLQGIFIEDVFIQKFDTAGSRGFWGEMRLLWAERARIDLDVRDCTDCYVFETHASHPQGKSSWDYGWFNLSFVTQVNQNAITLKGNVDMVGVDMSVVGNTVPGSGNTGVVLKVGTTSSDESIITGRLAVKVEENGTGLSHTDFTVAAAARIEAEGYRAFSGNYVSGVVSGRVHWPYLGNFNQTKATAGANLVYDPRLADGSYKRDASWAGGGGSISYTTAQMHSTPQCLQFVTSTATSSNNDRFVISTHNYGGDMSGDRPAQPLKVQGGQAFYYEIFARQKSTNTNTAGELVLSSIVIDTTGSNGITTPFATYVNQSSISSSAWTKVSGVLTIPAGFDTCCPVIQLQNHTVASQTWYFDDFRIIDVSMPLCTWVGPPGATVWNGEPGMIAQDTSWLYVCTTTNNWKRVALATW